MNCVKRFATAFTAVALAASVAAPLATSAQVDERLVRLEAKKQATPSAKGYCARVLAAAPAEHASGLMADRQQKLKTRRDEVAAFVASRRTGRDGALVESRAKLQGRYDAAIAKMSAKAVTPEGRSAVETFRAAVTMAATARKAAVDAAVKAFREGLDKAKAERQAAADAAIKAFSDAVQAAEAKAKADCAVATTDPERVRTDLKAAIDAARNTLQISLKTATRVGDEVPALGEARRVAVEQALNDYKAAIEQAKKEFKATISQK